LIFSDGSKTDLGSVDSKAGIWSVDLGVSDLANGVYAVVASGNGGGKGSAALIVASK